MTDSDMKNGAEVVPLPRRGKRATCPICGAPARHETRPFCSKRCADVDLGRWLKGGYAIPTEEPAGAEMPADGDVDDER